VESLDIGDQLLCFPAQTMPDGLQLTEEHLMERSESWMKYDIGV